MSQVSTLLKYGYPYVLAVHIEGLPHIFVEKIPRRVDNDAAPTINLTYTPGRTQVIPALIIEEGDHLKTDINRTTGVAKGSAFDIVLSFEALEEAGVLGDIFKRPTARGHLIVDIDHDDTSLTLDKANGFTSSGEVHVGKERISYTTNAGDVLAGTVARAVGSRQYNHSGDSPTYRTVVQGAPLHWLGREVTLAMHMLSPEGRFIGTSWFEGPFVADESARTSAVIWRGFVESPPEPKKSGMAIRCLPLCRLPARKIGFTEEYVVAGGGDMDIGAGDSINDMPIFVQADSYVQYSTYLTVHYLDAFAPFTHSGTGIAIAEKDADDKNGMYFEKKFYPTTTGFTTIGAWAKEIETKLQELVNGDSGGNTIWDCLETENGQNHDLMRSVTFNSLGITQEFNTNTIRFQWKDNVDEFTSTTPDSGRHMKYIKWQPDVSMSDSVYWLERSGEPAYGGNEGYLTAWYESGPDPMWHSWWGYKGSPDAGNLLPVKMQIGEDWSNTGTIPSSGLGVLSGGGKKELMSWSAAYAANSQVSLLTISGRGVHGTPVLDSDDLESAKLTIATGFPWGDMRSNSMNILQSSGTGTRGSYDALGEGLGYAIHEDLIDITSFDKGQLAGTFTAGAWDEPMSYEEMLGGWLVLSHKNLAQTIMSDDVKLRIIDTKVNDLLVLGNYATIATSDVLLSGVAPMKAADSPNEVRIDTSGIKSPDAPYVIARDIPRIQAETPKSLSLAVPGIDRAKALSLGASLIGRGEGQPVISVPCGSWCYAIQPGATVSITIAHPMFYDWINGARAPASLNGVVVGWKFDLFRGRVDLTILLQGHNVGATYLCPSAKMIGGGEGGTAATFQVSSTNVNFFSLGTKAFAYNPGKSDETDELTIDSIDTASGIITMDATLPVWTAIGKTYLTFPYVTNATTAQKAFMYTEDDDTWES